MIVVMSLASRTLNAIETNLFIFNWKMIIQPFDNFIKLVFERKLISKLIIKTY